MISANPCIIIKWQKHIAIIDSYSTHKWISRTTGRIDKTSSRASHKDIGIISLRALSLEMLRFFSHRRLEIRAFIAMLICPHEDLHRHDVIEKCASWFDHAALPYLCLFLKVFWSILDGEVSWISHGKV